MSLRRLFRDRREREPGKASEFVSGGIQRSERGSGQDHSGTTERGIVAFTQERPDSSASSEWQPMRYDPASNSIEPAGKCQDGAIALRNACLRWSTSFRYLGCYADRDIRNSSVNSVHRDGRAFDIGVNTVSPLSKAEMDELVNALVSVSEIVYMQQVIWYRRVWRTGIGWRDFDGASGPHTDHAHIEVNWVGAYTLTEEMAMAALYGPDWEEVPLTENDYKGIAKAILEHPIETTYDVGTPNQHQVTSNLGAIIANIGIQLDRLVAAQG